jgi:hypothetical protein
VTRELHVHVVGLATEQVAVKWNTTGEWRALARVQGRWAIWGAAGRYGWTGQQSGSGFSDLAPSILHYNWF